MNALTRISVAVLCTMSMDYAAAQRSPIAVPKPLPIDLTPRISLSSCGHFRGGFGPMDYRTADSRDRAVVEEFHLDVELRTFLSGQLSGVNMTGTGGVAGGFQYTLRAFPNHPVALLVLDQLGRKLKSETPQGMQIPLECWYMRAFMIAPDDPVVRALYGIYLANRGRDAEAQMNLKLGDAGTHNSPALQHQIGMTYFQMKRYEDAQLCAMRLSLRHFPIDTLARQLREVGKWNPELKLPANETSLDDLDPASTDAAASAASAASNTPP